MQRRKSRDSFFAADLELCRERTKYPSLSQITKYLARFLRALNYCRTPTVVACPLTLPVAVVAGGAKKLWS